MPDAFVFALAATFVVLVAAWAVDPAVRQSPIRLVDTWGAGFWALIPFTLQMTMIIIGGYGLASLPPKLAAIVGEIPLTETIFRWESLVCVAVEMAVVSAVVWLIAPGEGRGRP